MPRSLIAMMFGGKEIQQISVIAQDPETLAETGIMAAAKLTENKEVGRWYVFDI